MSSRQALDRYQDVLLPGRLIPGARDCATRWALFEHLIPEAGVLVDVGSNLGYFAMRAALERRSLAVLSLEPDSTIAERQAGLVQSHGLERICVVQGRMTAETARAWANTCDWVDVTLLLSVLHWTDDPAEVLRQLASMSAVVIVELPDAEDDGACGRELLQLWRSPLDWVTRVTGREALLLGRPPRHTSGIPAHMIAIVGPTGRQPVLAYWGSRYRHPQGNLYYIRYDGSNVRISIRGVERAYRPGVNLASMMSLGRLVYPPPRHWLRLGAAALSASPHHPDPMPHNMVWSASGLSLVDEEPLTCPRALGEAQESLRQNVMAWRSGRTAFRAAYRPEVFGWRRRARRSVVTLLRRLLPERAFEWLRHRLGSPRVR
jgi:hypothetical protein